MKFRPWPIVILALVHILAPLINILYSAWIFKLNILYYLAMTFGHGHFWANAPHFIGFPLAGIAIYKCNRWSYPAFLVVQAWMMVANFETWRQYPQYFGLGSLLLSYIVTLAVVTYFLIPEVRNVYFNPRLRWWEHQPRYDVSWNARMGSGDSEREAIILNLSEGGAFIESPMIALAGAEVQVKFTAFEKDYDFTAKVAHARRAEPQGYGLQFVHTPETQAQAKKLIKKVKGSGAQERIGSVNLWEEFRSWFVSTIKTGKGLVPVTPGSEAREPQSEDQKRSA